MRISTCLVAAATAMMVSAAPAAAAWEQYTFEKQGYLVSFPGKPTEGTGTYSSRVVPTSVPAHYARYEDETGIYISGVIETGHDEKGAAMLGEADYLMTHFGDVAQNNASRTGNEDYGRFMTVDCRDGVIPEGNGDLNGTIRAIKTWKDAMGLECAQGSRMVVNLIFKSGRIHVVAGINKPGPNAKRGMGAGRFASSIVWAGANATLVDIVQQTGRAP